MYVISESLLKSYKKCDALIASQKYFYLIHMAARQQVETNASLRMGE